MPDRNRERHGHFYSEVTGQVSLVTQECTYHGGPYEDDDEEVWEPEILLVLTERRQLNMVRVLAPNGRTYELQLDD